MGTGSSSEGPFNSMQCSLQICVLILIEKNWEDVSSAISEVLRELDLLPAYVLLFS